MIFASFMINVKKIWKQKSIIALILIVPIVVSVFCYLFQSRAAIVTLSIGIVFDESDAYSKAIYEDIISDSSLHFVRYTVDKLDLAVSGVETGDLECAYVIDSDITGKIDDGEFENIITVIKSPKTISDAIINEKFYAAVIKAASPRVTAAMLSKLLGVAYEDIEAVIKENILAYYERDIYVESKSSFEKGKDEDRLPYMQTRILHGITGILMLIVIIFLLPLYIDEKKLGFVKLLNKKNIYLYYLSVYILFFAVNLWMMLVLYLAKSILFPIAIFDTGTEMLFGILFSLAIGGIGLLLVQLLHKSDFIYSAFIFILLLNLFLGGSLVDLNEINALMGKASMLFPSSFYINGVLHNGTGNGRVLLLIALVAFLGTALLIHMNREYKKN